MRFGIKNFIRKWVRKLLPRNSVEKELKVQIAISGAMDNAIQLWKDMYENHPPWEGKDGTLCTNLPATIAEEMSRLVLTEFELSTTGSQLADFINTQLERELTDLDIHVERYCAKGGIVMKPYVSVGPTGLPEKIEIDFVEADHFYPTAYNSKGEIMSAVFLQHKRMGDFLYTRLEYHEFTGNSITILNRAYRSEKISSYNDSEEPIINYPFDEEVPLAEVEEWAGLSETPVTINNVEKPLFVYIKTAKSNNIDNSSPLGVSVYSKSISGTPISNARSSIVLINSLAVSIVQSERENSLQPVRMICSSFKRSFISSGAYPVKSAISRIVAYAFFLCSALICLPSSNHTMQSLILFFKIASSRCRSGMKICK